MQQLEAALSVKDEALRVARKERNALLAAVRRLGIALPVEELTGSFLPGTDGLGKKLPKEVPPSSLLARGGEAWGGSQRSPGGRGGAAAERERRPGPGAGEEPTGRYHLRAAGLHPSAHAEVVDVPSLSSGVSRRTDSVSSSTSSSSSSLWEAAVREASTPQRA